MPTLIIDNQPVDVPEGATILDAAEKLGIEIPTLCFAKGYQPATSCSVCVVKNRQTGKFVPACATQVVDGMQVDNATDEVGDMRRMALELLLSDHVGDCLAPCFFACPAHMDIPLMLRQIQQNHVREAIKTVKRDIALPAVLGRVCPKPCEKACRRKEIDDPVAICQLKRYVADEDLRAADPYKPDSRPDTGKRIAIVGAGPTGLAAIYYLRQLGHDCVLYEKEPRGGGRLRYETDAKELPRDILDREIEQVMRLGIEAHWGSPVADKHGLDSLRDQFDAVLLACGNVGDEQIEAWGLTAGQRGIKYDRNTYQAEHDNLFAAGIAVRGKAAVVRSVADGKEVARVIDRFVSGEVVRGPARPFSSRMGKLTQEELARLQAGAGAASLAEPDQGQEYLADQAAEQAHRCLACDCTAHGDCKLERYCIMYQANANRFSGERCQYDLLNRHGQVVFEPGKCIKCELCVKIAASAHEPLGLSFVGRGFEVKLQVPFDGSMDEALTEVARLCVEHCPTAALRLSQENIEPASPYSCSCAAGKKNAVG